MFGVVFKLFGLALAIILMVYLGANAFRKSRRLDRRIREFKAEQERLKQQGKVLDPYAALAELYTERTQEKPQPDPRRRKSGR